MMDQAFVSLYLIATGSGVFLIVELSVAVKEQSRQSETQNHLITTLFKWSNEFKKLSKMHYIYYMCQKSNASIKYSHNIKFK